MPDVGVDRSSTSKGFGLICFGCALISIESFASQHLLCQVDHHWCDEKRFVEVEAARRAINIKSANQLLFLSHSWRDPSMQMRKRRIVAHLSNFPEVRKFPFQTPSSTMPTNRPSHPRGLSFILCTYLQQPFPEIFWFRGDVRRNKTRQGVY